MKQVKQTLAADSGWVVRHSPVVFPASHALLVHGSVQLTLAWEDGLMVDDNCLNDLVNVGLAGHGVLVVWYWHQRWAEANGQIVGVHHVLVTVLRQTGGQTQSSHPVPCGRSQTGELRRDGTYWFKKANKYLMTTTTGRWRVMVICCSWWARSPPESSSETEPVWEQTVSHLSLFHILRQLLLKRQRRRHYDFSISFSGVKRLNIF